MKKGNEFASFVLHEETVLINNLTLGRLRHHLTDVLSRSNSQTDGVFNRQMSDLDAKKWT